MHATYFAKHTTVPNETTALTQPSYWQHLAEVPEELQSAVRNGGPPHYFFSLQVNSRAHTHTYTHTVAQGLML